MEVTVLLAESAPAPPVAPAAAPVIGVMEAGTETEAVPVVVAVETALVSTERAEPEPEEAAAPSASVVGSAIACRET